HMEYMALARAEAAEQDYDDTDYFGTKALGAVEAANEGATVPDPQEVSERDLPEDQIDTLINARDVLMEALMDGRRAKPGHAARAQAMFDCWIQEQEENIQPDDIAACRQGFFMAMGELAATEAMPMEEAAPAPVGEPVKTVGPFTVYFGFNSASLDSAANALIDSLANHKYANDELGYVILSGHADRSGNVAYNEMLSEKRVTAVADAFMAKGITARILSTFYGEDRPSKMTDDGMREPKNRRVEITLSR
ncbi:MAG: OmpA family protein, partial [Alphaproteobacteria bacterium]|nr:OmpA family protein [Alphaproteobacteria bacterium]